MGNQLLPKSEPDVNDGAKVTVCVVGSGELSAPAIDGPGWPPPARVSRSAPIGKAGHRPIPPWDRFHHQ
jgi:hypothetical protein